MNQTHLVMHGLAVKKHATPEVVAGIVGLETDEVRKVLVNLVEAKRVAEADRKSVV